MRVLVACEESQVVTKAFRDKGHTAFSCDIEPCSGGYPQWHIQGNVLDHIKNGNTWDLMIAHPPCTYLTVANTYLKRGCSKYTREQAYQLQLNAVVFFLKLAYAPIPKICMENPVGIMSTLFRKPDQIIQPWQFGHPESKRTCLWLKNIPKLNYSIFAEFKKYRCKCGKVFPADMGKYGCCNYPATPLWDNQTPSGQNKLGPSGSRSKIRSRTYENIAKAMAEAFIN